MTALATDRNTARRKNVDFEYPVVAADIIYAGSLVALDASGNLQPGATATGLIAAGRAEERVDNSAGGAAAKTCKVKSGCFKWANGDLITKTSIGDQAYIVDDQTVSKASAGKSPAGVIVDVEADGVWVYTAAPLLAPSTGLLAANNLSDLDTVATALINLGLQSGATDLDLNNVEVDQLLATEGVRMVDNAQALFHRSAVVTVSATEVRNLAASPKTLVAAVAGKAFIFKGCAISYRGGSNGFDSVGAGEDLAVRQTDGSGTILSTSLDTTSDINFGATTDDEAYMPPLAATYSPIANTPLVLDNIGGGELAAADMDANGDGVLTVAIDYDEYTLIA